MKVTSAISDLSAPSTANISNIANSSHQCQSLNVSSILESLARQHCCRPALIDVSEQKLRVASFGDLEEEVRQSAKILTLAGVRSLDSVLIFVPLQRELISLLLAIFRLGAKAVFIDPSYGPKKIWHCLNLARPKFLIVDRRLQIPALLAPLFGIKGMIMFGGGSSAWCSIKARLHIIKSVMTDIPATSDIAMVPAEHPALITFTSGSTGMPKGIVRSHGFLMQQSKLLQKTLPARRADLSGFDGLNVMTPLPMFILAALAAGQTSIIPAEKRDRLLHQLQYIAIDRLLCAPHSLQNICHLLADSGIRLPALTEVIVGGGPVFPGLLSQISRAMPGARIVTVYGSTEAEPICHRAVQDVQPIKLVKKERGLPLGKAIDEITLDIVDPRALGQKRSFTSAQFEAIKLPTLKEGEIVVSGGHVVSGYLGGQGDSETKFEVDGRIFHRTGDAGYINNLGEVFLTGRVAYAVSNRECTVYPLTVELLAMDNEAVERCAFVEVGGKAVLALKLKAGRKNAVILQQLKQVFAEAEVVIDRYVVVNALPLDQRHQSKIVYSKLKRQLRFAS